MGRHIVSQSVEKQQKCLEGTNGEQLPIKVILIALISTIHTEHQLVLMSQSNCRTELFSGHPVQSYSTDRVSGSCIHCDTAGRVTNTKWAPLCVYAVLVWDFQSPHGHWELPRSPAQALSSLPASPCLFLTDWHEGVCECAVSSAKRLNPKLSDSSLVRLSSLAPQLTVLPSKAPDCSVFFFHLYNCLMLEELFPFKDLNLLSDNTYFKAGLRGRLKWSPQ